MAASLSDRSDTESTDGAGAHQKDPRSSTPLMQKQQSQTDDRPVVVKKLEPTPTARLDRTHDRVYDATTAVVRSVMILSQGVQQARSDQYVDLVKKVGMELRTLLTSVDQLVPHFPASTHREVRPIFCLFVKFQIFLNPLKFFIRWKWHTRCLVKTWEN